MEGIVNRYLIDKEMKALLEEEARKSRRTVGEVLESLFNKPLDPTPNKISVDVIWFDVSNVTPRTEEYWDIYLSNGAIDEIEERATSIRRCGEQPYYEKACLSAFYRMLVEKIRPVS